MSAKLSPAMAQFMAAKQHHPDALVFFRMGDFYELFFDDAKVASKALGITLTSRNKSGDNPIPMAGVPIRAADGYLKRLVKAGHRVAICEQMQDPKEVKGLVDRQVIRVITPGTLTEDNLLDDQRPNHLAAVTAAKGRNGIAWVELSTGAFWVTELQEQQLGDELGRLDPAEVLVAEDTPLATHLSHTAPGASLTRRSGYDFDFESAHQTLAKFFRTGTLAGFGVEDMPLAVGAAGALIRYLEETQLAAVPQIRKIQVFPRSSVMRLDRATRQSLELVQTMRGRDDGTPLLSVLDRTCTAMGARLLREWLLTPLIEVSEIHDRQAAVEELWTDPGLAQHFHSALDGVFDLQRLTARICCGRGNARDLVALGGSLQRLPAIHERLQKARSSGLSAIAARLDVLADVAADISATLVDQPPVTLSEGGLIRAGFHPELDELVTLSRDSLSWIARYQAEQIERTGISSLKVSFNKVFGYYIEITAAHRHVELPADYVRKQTTKNAERYITAELEVFETKALEAGEKSRELEYQLFLALRDRVAQQTARLQQTADAVAALDVYVGLALVAKDRGYCRPVIDDSRALEIRDGRHPVLEATHAQGTVVPNDTDLDPPSRTLILLTGPNMAGKSTYIRQTALITLMAQIGSFVPAASARIGVVDRIFTRVGAADDISQGASTFMVEMTETANILNNATRRSLVILDEVGRGTSTYDGLSLAWAIAENLVEGIGCRALFATHYHQLTDLSGPGKGVVNQRVAVKEWGDEIVFLHRIEDGGTDKSYGLHVGRLAGLPATVLERARAILARLEEEGEQVKESLEQSRRLDRPAPRQLQLFTPPRQRVLDELARLRTEQMTPLEALQKLAEWEALLRRHPAD
ncbi:MAG: DNA mismatch repair protein MutS [Planctomycetes bacterium]|nr:DNA mismatch repair protein MutS [Planctomycetota bacterium]